MLCCALLQKAGLLVKFDTRRLLSLTNESMQHPNTFHPTPVLSGSIVTRRP